MSLGQGTQVVDGQRNLFPTVASYMPTGYGPSTTGVPQVSPTMPPFIGAANNGTGSAGAAFGLEGVGGYGTAANNTQVAAIAGANPHNLSVSPMWWAVIMLVVGLVLLKAINWRETTLEHFTESGEAGPVGERGEESVR
jgi:hypothetical protein